MAGATDRQQRTHAGNGTSRPPARLRFRGIRNTVLIVVACLVPAAAAAAIFALTGTYRTAESSDPAAALAFTTHVRQLLAEDPDMTLDVADIAGHTVETVCLIPFFDTVGSAAEDLGQLAAVPVELRDRYIGDHNVGLLMIGADRSTFGELDDVWAWDFFPPRGCYEGGPFALRARDLGNLDGLVLLAGDDLELELASPILD